MKSVLILGFPRGFTDETYRFAKALLPGLREPLMANGEVLNGGEILNSDRCIGLTQVFPFYVRPEDPLFEAAYQEFARILEAHREGFLLKDVVQPYIVMRFLAENPGAMRVLFVDRPADEVIYTLWRKGWTYPDNPRGLRQQLRHYPAFDVRQALVDEQYTRNFFQQRFAGELSEDKFHYIDYEFEQRRDNFYSEYRRPLWINNFQRMREWEAIGFEHFFPYEPGMNGRWSGAQQAWVCCDLGKPVEANCFIQLRLMLPGCFAQSSTIRLAVDGDESIGSAEAEFAPGQWHNVELPVPKGAERLRIRINNGSLYDPASGLAEGETRSLGVGVFGIGLFEAQVK